MASGASSWRFPPITLSAVTRDRLDRRDNDRYAADPDVLVPGGHA
jgi:hypothetical protein